MEQELISEMESLSKRLLTKDGKPKKDADQAELSRLTELRKQYDDEHAVELPKGARIETRTKDVVICVGGETKLKRVPSDFQNKKK
jgi:hypothetical protein